MLITVACMFKVVRTRIANCRHTFTDNASNICGTVKNLSEEHNAHEGV